MADTPFSRRSVVLILPEGHASIFKLRPGASAYSDDPNDFIHSVDWPATNLKVNETADFGLEFILGGGGAPDLTFSGQMAVEDTGDDVTFSHFHEIRTSNQVFTQFAKIVATLEDDSVADALREIYIGGGDDEDTEERLWVHLEEASEDATSSDWVQRTQGPQTIACINVCDFVRMARSAGSLLALTQSGVLGRPVVRETPTFLVSFWNMCLAPPASLYLTFFSRSRRDDPGEPDISIKLYFTPPAANGLSTEAAELDDAGNIVLIKYARRRPEGYPMVGLPLSSGTTALQTLLALASLFGLSGTVLTDASKVAGCDTYLALLRWAVGRPAFYESFGFRPEGQTATAAVNRLKKRIAALPALTQAATDFFSSRNRGAQVCDIIDRVFAEVSARYQPLSRRFWARATNPSDLNTWLQTYSSERCS